MANVEPSLHLLNQLKGGKKTYQFNTNGRLQRIIAKIKASPKSRSFAELLESSTGAQGIFLNHWKQTSFLAEFSLPLYFGSQEKERPLSVLRNAGSEGKAELDLTIERILERARPELEEALERFAARLKRQGVDLEGSEQEAMMKVIFQMFGGLSWASPTKAIFSMLRPYEDFFADELPDAASLLIDSLKAGMLNSGFERRQSVLQSSGLTLESYENEVTKFANLGYLRPALSLLWCNEHGQYPRSLIVVGHSAVPGGSKCDLCRRPLRSGTFYVPSSPAMSFAREYEGAMLPLMAWDLERNEIPWNAHVQLKGENDPEKDLVFRWSKSQKVSIIECKSYYRDTNDRVRADNIATLLRQLEQQIGAYESRGIRVDQALLATNYPATSVLKDHVTAQVEETKGLKHLRNVSVRLIGPGNLADWWRN